MYISSETPVWNWLIEPTLSSSKRIGMINRIFSDRDEAEKFKDLTGSDARAFVDVVDKASIHVFSPLEGCSVEPK